MLCDCLPNESQIRLYSEEINQSSDRRMDCFILLGLANFNCPGIKIECYQIECLSHESCIFSSGTFGNRSCAKGILVPSWRWSRLWIDTAKLALASSWSLLHHNCISNSWGNHDGCIRCNCSQALQMHEGKRTFFGPQGKKARIWFRWFVGKK